MIRLKKIKVIIRGTEREKRFQWMEFPFSILGWKIMKRTWEKYFVLLMEKKLEKNERRWESHFVPNYNSDENKSMLSFFWKKMFHLNKIQQKIFGTTWITWEGASYTGDQLWPESVFSSFIYKIKYLNIKSVSFSFCYIHQIMNIMCEWIMNEST